MITDILKPLSPKTNGWSIVEKIKSPTIFSAIWYQNGHLLVCSAVEVADKEIGPEYHISVSRINGEMADSIETNFVLKDFGAHGAEEDNHVPFGIVRNFWLPIAENLIGKECECKDSENAIKENKGDYIWRT